MLRIDANDLEEVLFAVEDVLQEESYSGAIFQEFKERVQKKGGTMPRAFLEKFIEVTELLLEPSRRDKLGHFLVITGVDKSGKETQAFNDERKPEIRSAYDYLEGRSFEVFKLALPSYHTTFGSLISSYLGKKNSVVSIVGTLSKEIAWVLWSLDRGQHNGEIEKWLQNSSKRIVLSKRWTETNIAYQEPQGIDGSRILQFERNLAKADYTIVLDVPLETVFTRMTVSGEVPDRYETWEFLSKVSNVYKNLENSYHIGKVIHIDGSGSFAEVNSKLIATIAEIGFSQFPQTISEKSC